MTVQFITQTELQSAISTPTMVAIYDDDLDGAVSGATDQAAIDLVLSRANAHVASYLPAHFVEEPLDSYPNGTPTLLKSAALDFAVAFSYERHPEYVRTYGNDKVLTLHKRADALMIRIQSGLQRFAEPQGSGNPDNIPVPRTNGGIVVTSGPRLFADDGIGGSGDF